jgi:hypothetical protein
MTLNDNTQALWEELREADRNKRNFESLASTVATLASWFEDADYSEDSGITFPPSDEVAALVLRAKQLAAAFGSEGLRVQQQFRSTAWRFLEAAYDLRDEDRILCSDWHGRPLTVVARDFWVGDGSVGDMLLWCTIVRKDGSIGKRDHSFHLQKDSWSKKPVEHETRPLD